MKERNMLYEVRRLSAFGGGYLGKFEALTPEGAIREAVAAEKSAGRAAHKDWFRATAVRQ